MDYFIGIDPGPTNIGWCCINQDRTFYLGGVYLPKDDETQYEIASRLINNILDNTFLSVDDFFYAVIERFVPYGGTFTNQSEKVCELIGAVTFCLQQHSIPVIKGRAIDWKPAICRKLFLSEGFTNPEKSFNKKYSIAVAEHISGKTVFKTNHEADACGLAFYASILRSRGKYGRPSLS